jgi:serine protease Do
LADLVERVIPGVVALSGIGKDFTSSGSGFLLDTGRHVVTNFHVIENLQPPFDAVFRGTPRQKSTVIGMDPLTDLALLEVEEAPPWSLKFRETPVRLGELCIGIGSPFGRYPESVSVGVVSGLARTIPQRRGRPIQQAIQTDAAINPGNSGGPLLDVHGEVIGVNQCVDPRGSAIGFAIPADTVKWVSSELLEHGRVVRAALGCTVERRPVVFDGKSLVGLAVTKLGRSTSSKDLKVGDVILRVEDEEVDETSDLYRILTKDRIGKPTPVEVLRNGSMKTLTVHPIRLEGTAPKR